MDGFFGSNPGLRSRVAHHLDFSDFTLEELMRIAHTMLEQQRYRLDDPAQVAFRAYLQRRMALPDFANARSVRNAIDRIKLRHANRIYSGSGLATREELERIDAADILKSRVFLAAPAPAAPSDVL
jgi:hypothetical protein